MRANIKFLADSAREDNTLLKDEIDNFQTQTELKLTQIQNGCYTFENEVTQLRLYMFPKLILDFWGISTFWDLCRIYSIYIEVKKVPSYMYL